MLNHRYTVSVSIIGKIDFCTISQAELVKIDRGIRTFCWVVCRIVKVVAMEQKNIFVCVKYLVYRQATHVNSTMDGGTYTSASFVMIGSGNRPSRMRYPTVFQNKDADLSARKLPLQR